MYYFRVFLFISLSLSKIYRFWLRPHWLRLFTKSLKTDIPVVVVSAHHHKGSVWSWAFRRWIRAKLADQCSNNPPQHGMSWRLEDSCHNSECWGLHLPRMGLLYKRNEQPLSLVRTSSVGHLSRPVLLRHWGEKNPINDQQIDTVDVEHALQVGNTSTWHSRLVNIWSTVLQSICIPLGGAPHPSGSCGVPLWIARWKL